MTLTLWVLFLSNSIFINFWSKFADCISTLILRWFLWLNVTIAVQQNSDLAAQKAQTDCISISLTKENACIAVKAHTVTAVLERRHVNIYTDMVKVNVYIAEK